MYFGFIRWRRVGGSGGELIENADDVLIAVDTDGTAHSQRRKLFRAI